MAKSTAKLSLELSSASLGAGVADPLAGLYPRAALFAAFISLQYKVKAFSLLKSHWCHLFNTAVKHARGREGAIPPGMDFLGEFVLVSFQEGFSRGTNVSPNPLQILTVLYFFVQEGS